LARFLHIAMGSASELEVHLLLTRDLDLLNNPDYEQLEKEVTEEPSAKVIKWKSLRRS